MTLGVTGIYGPIGRKLQESVYKCARTCYYKHVQTTHNQREAVPAMKFKSVVHRKTRAIGKNKAYEDYIGTCETTKESRFCTGYMGRGEQTVYATAPAGTKCSFRLTQYTRQDGTVYTTLAVQFGKYPMIFKSSYDMECSIDEAAGRFKFVKEEA